MLCVYKPFDCAQGDIENFILKGTDADILAKSSKDSVNIF